MARPDELDRRVAEVLRSQDGVISRRQVLAAGGSPAYWERKLRRREWVTRLPGVFLDHTGQPTWRQRAWIGLRYLWPAALAEDSALRMVAGADWDCPSDTIVLAIRQDRHVRAPDGYRITRPTNFAGRVQWNATPPRIRVEEATLDAAAGRRTDLDAVAVVAGVCQRKLTTADRLQAALRVRGRIARRDWLTRVLADVAVGAWSTLEHGYLAEVERAHGLPRGDRQVGERTPTGAVARDVRYERGGLIVELDGRLFHDSAEQRDRDLDRDLVAAALSGSRTIRLGWGQVFSRPCATAAYVGILLRRGGWDGRVQPCRRPGCQAGQPLVP